MDGMAPVQLQWQVDDNWVCDDALLASQNGEYCMSEDLRSTDQGLWCKTKQMEQ